ncbi:hypothetical protein B0H34DRAFT_290509 [Crassisporium funariophilum]|nr:hypothetical protein B0H34DRAFT_290509 [Crassisporium funariophilum]
MPRLVFHSYSSLVEIHNEGTYRTEQGQLIYQVDTPYKISGRKSTIYRSMPGASSHHGSEQNLAKVAEIEFHQFSPTILRYGDRETSEHELFEGGNGTLDLTYSTRDRPFTAPDGRRYVWVPGASRDAKLYLDGPQMKLVAEHHLAHLGILHTESSHIFEVLPDAEHILDFIFMTYIFIQELARNRRRVQRNDII